MRNVLALLIVVLVVFGIAAIHNQNSPSSSAPSTTASQPAIKPNTPRLPFFPLPEIAEPFASNLREMIDASQTDDEERIAKARVAQEKIPKPRLAADKALRKQVREKNAEGTRLLSAGKIDLAAQSYFDGWQLDPADVELADNLGYTLLKAGEYDEARKILLSALALSPARANAWNSLGMAYAALSKPTDALSAFQNAWRYSRSRSKTLSTWLAVADSDPNALIQRATDQAYTKTATRGVAEQFRPIVGRLRTAGVPVLLPSDLKIVSDDQARPGTSIFSVDNKTFPIEASEDGYSIPLANTPDCDGMYCLLGDFSARKGEAEQPSLEQEAIPLSGNTAAIWKAGSEKGFDRITFHRDGVNYSIALIAQREVLVEIAKAMAGSLAISPTPRKLVIASPSPTNVIAAAASPGSGNQITSPIVVPPVTVASPQLARLSEEAPPAGSGNVLTDNQIRYCVAESIRLKAHEAQVNTFSQSSVNAFNRFVEDYNLRCANFRYRRGLLESVRSEVEGYRQALEREGIARASGNP